MVSQTLEQGLRHARVLSADTPDFVVSWLVSEHNRHHAGSGDNVLSLVSDALQVEANWKRRCADTGMTSRAANYQKHYDTFVRQGSPTFAENVTSFSDAKSLGHTLQQWEIYHAFEEPPIAVIFFVIFALSSQIFVHVMSCAPG